MPRIATTKTAPTPMAPYVMRLELSPPKPVELEVSVLASEDEEVEAVEEPAIGSVGSVEEDIALLVLLDGLEPHESEQS